MNLAQYNFYRSVKAYRNKLMKEVNRLERYCEKPENQHCWDEWKEKQAFADGVDYAIGVLQKFNELGKKRLI